MNPITLLGGEHAVMLIHGLQSSPAELLPLAKRLHQAGYTVHMPHIAGYGFMRGDTPRSVTHWQDWRAEALEEFRMLQRQYKTVAVGGLSIGGALSLSIAAELGDEIAALALLSTPLWYDGWGIPWYHPFRYLGYVWPLRYLSTYREGEPFGLKNPLIRKCVAREMSHKDASIAGASRLYLTAIQEAERLSVSVKKSLPRITAPAIIIHAVEDEIASPRSAHHIVKHIGSRTVEIVLLHNSYHMITMDNDRKQVASDTIRFFDRVRAERAVSQS